MRNFSKPCDGRFELHKLGNRRIGSLVALLLIGALIVVLKLHPWQSVTGVSASTRVQGGYAKNESFCGGTVQYRVSDKIATVTLNLVSLSPHREYSLDWMNNTVRGYTIGAFKTTSGGKVVSGSLRLFRPAETHGIRVNVYYITGGVNPTDIHHYGPC